MIYRALRKEWDDVEGFENFIESLQGQTDDLAIYLSGESEAYHWCFKFLDFVGRYPGEVTLVAPAQANYAVALFFIASNSKKCVLPMASLRILKPTWELSTGKSRSYEIERNRTEKTGENLLNYIEPIIKQLLSEEEWKIYESYEPVDLFYDRISEIIPLAEKMFFRKKKKEAE
jgi:hypothetical protein